MLIVDVTTVKLKLEGNANPRIGLDVRRLLYTAFGISELKYFLKC